jgi:hypothetical protein
MDHRQRIETVNRLEQRQTALMGQLDDLSEQIELVLGNLRCEPAVVGMGDRQADSAGTLLPSI